MVVSLHLEVEDLGVIGGGRGDEASVEELEDSVVDVGELGLDLGAVVTDDGDLVLVAATSASSRGSNGPRSCKHSQGRVWRTRSRSSVAAR